LRLEYIYFLWGLEYAKAILYRAIRLYFVSAAIPIPVKFTSYCHNLYIFPHSLAFNPRASGIGTTAKGGSRRDRNEV